MNVTRENLSDLELCIKVEVAAADYAESVSKQLKRYRQQATVPGFRKGMAPMGMIERLYKPTLVAEEVTVRVNLATGAVDVALGQQTEHRIHPAVVRIDVGNGGVDGLRDELGNTDFVDVGIVLEGLLYVLDVRTAPVRMMPPSNLSQ